MSASLASIARALGGEVVGHQVLCPGPRHSRKDRSLSVRLSPSAPDGFVVHSYAGDDPLDAKDHVRRQLGWEAFSPRQRGQIGEVETSPTRRRHREAVVSTSPSGKDVSTSLGGAETPASDDDARRIAAARRIWQEGRDPRGTIVEAYLNSRGLKLPAEVAGDAIRFHERCPWRDEVAGRTIFVPAMLGAMRSIATEEITAVHRTRLTPDGQKVDRRMLGKASGAAIMLCPFSAIGAGLTLGEGIETALSAWRLGWSNVWALGSVGAIVSFPVLAGVQTLTLLAETDDGGASAKAIDAVGNRYVDADREVLLITPTISGDLNDVVQRGMPS